MHFVIINCQKEKEERVSSYRELVRSTFDNISACSLSRKQVLYFTRNGSVAASRGQEKEKIQEESHKKTMHRARCRMLKERRRREEWRSRGERKNDRKEREREEHLGGEYVN